MQPYYDPMRGWVYPEPTSYSNISPRRNPFMEKLDSIKKQLQEIEGGYVNNPDNYDDTSTRYRGAPIQNTQPTTASKEQSIIPVKSIEEAWNYDIPKWRFTSAGEKFLFYNEKDGEFYYKWYNFDIPKMMYQTFRLTSEDVTEAEPTKNVSLSDIMDKVNGLESRMDKIMAMASMFISREPEVVS